jgi:hypothetical protein
LVCFFPVIAVIIWLGLKNGDSLAFKRSQSKQKRLMDPQTCSSLFMRIGQIIKHHIKCLVPTYKLLASLPHRRSKVRVLFRPHMNPLRRGFVLYAWVHGNLLPTPPGAQAIPYGVIGTSRSEVQLLIPPPIFTLGMRYPFI